MSRKRKGSHLPQKRMRTSIEFTEEVPICAVKLSLLGLKEDELTKEQRKELSIKSCPHPVWPPFMPQCVECLGTHEYERYLEDTKGRKYKVIK